MDSSLPSESTNPKKGITVKLFGVGNAGTAIVQHVMDGGPAPTAFVALNTDPQSLLASAAFEKLHLETKLLRGLGSGGDPDRGRAVAQEHAEQLKTLCQGVDVIFIVAGLGGGAGGGISPVLAHLAKEAGALVLVFVTLPFDCEGSRRRHAAEQALEELREVADGVVCLPNQKVFGLLGDNMSVLEAFGFTNRLLADCARGLWRLLAHPGLIEIHLADLCDLLRADHTDCSFAVAEAAGATRSREVVDKLLAHPLLDSGTMLTDCHGVLVSLIGGPDLTMTEVNRVMEELNARCGRAHVIMGAVIDEQFRERLAVTVIAVRKAAGLSQTPAAARRGGEDLDGQLLRGSEAARPNSRFVPPPPALAPEQMQQMMAGQAGARSPSRKSIPKFRQAHLPLEIVSKGRFDKSEPTIHKGEDLDVPTYIRRGISLN